MNNLLGDAVPSVVVAAAAGGKITGQDELERLIRLVATNPDMTAIQKNTTIQGLRDSVWKSNQKQRESCSEQAHLFAPQDTTVLTRCVVNKQIIWFPVSYFLYINCSRYRSFPFFNHYLISWQ